MKIIILDAKALNPGDLSWEPIKRLGSVDIYDNTADGLVIQRCKDADAIIINKTVVNNELLEKLPKLKYVGVTATGYNVVDTAASRQRGVTVTNVPSYSTDSVAQMTISLLLEMCNNVGLHSESVKSGDWCDSDTFCYWKKPLVELTGLRMGLVGFGHIGQAVAKIARAFGMQIAVTGTSKNPADYPDTLFLPLNELLSTSDVVSLHCPLTTENAKMINKQRLDLMKKNAMLINTARGGLIDEQALADALNSGQIAGAAVDVLSSEPPQCANPLLTAENCFITPHIAWATRASRNRLMDVVVKNVEAFINGTPVNVVN